LAGRIANELGGVVLPTFFVGTETMRQPGDGPQELGPLGLGDDQRVTGMDFPANPVKSLYFEESAFGIVVREVVRGLKADGFRLIALVNGHGAPNHKRTLARIAHEETLLPEVRVLDLFAWDVVDGGGPGHADRLETAIMLAIAPDCVRLDELPDGPLRYAEHGIVDGAAFEARPGKGFVLPPERDPRAATREEGEEILDDELRAAVSIVRAELARLGFTGPVGEYAP
jgi:creatinine amidohydrolase/Fe(II)-dependent formamide hydrolase-like protein